MALANLEAVRLKHDSLMPVHILLGLLAKGGNVSSLVLRNLNVDIEELREAAAKSVSPGREAPHMAKLPQAAGTKEVIEFAIDEARKLGHQYVGTEHLLLGLLREGHDPPAQLLAQRGVKIERLREEVLTLLNSAKDEDHTPPGAGHGGFEWLHQQELAKAFRSAGFWHLLILAVDSANRLGDGEVHHEHLLLALLRDETHPVARWLRDRGITLDIVRDWMASGRGTGTSA